MGRMPKFVDYTGRFAFFEEAAFAIVRDEGVHRLSRHRVAAVLGTSITTIRRLLGRHADLRSLALREVGHRRRAGRRGRPVGDPPAVADQLLRRALPDSAERVAEELVWWRLAITAPTRAALTDSQDPDGSLRDRFAIGMWGYVPERDPESDPSDRESDAESDPTPASGDDACAPADDPVTEAVADRAREIDGLVAAALGVLGCSSEHERARTAALLDGLGVGVCLGRLTPDDACQVLSRHLADLGPARPRPDPGLTES